jgi:hypothetical protein
MYLLTLKSLSLKTLQYVLCSNVFVIFWTDLRNKISKDVFKKTSVATIASLVAEVIYLFIYCYDLKLNFQFTHTMK